MAKELTPQEMFERVCRAIAPGNTWPAATADLLEVRRDTVRHWISGRIPLRADHFQSLLGLLAQRRAGIEQAEAELRDWLSRGGVDVAQERK
jgi:hypothetical protein